MRFFENTNYDLQRDATCVLSFHVALLSCCSVACGVLCVGLRLVLCAACCVVRDMWYASCMSRVIFSRIALTVLANKSLYCLLESPSVRAACCVLCVFYAACVVWLLLMAGCFRNACKVLLLFPSLSPWPRTTRTMVHGPWSTDHGPQTMVHGSHGRRTMVHGL